MFLNYYWEVQYVVSVVGSTVGQPAAGADCPTFVPQVDSAGSRAELVSLTRDAAVSTVVLLPVGALQCPSRVRVLLHAT